MSAKIFRDPLYNYISIDRERDGWLLRVLDSPEVQRLRRIHQLGVSHFTYPGADHSRLSHSLGVLHLMQEALLHLDAAQQRDAQVDRGRHPLLAAALLHDVGHGPFSHLFEPCLGIDHERWSCEIVRSPETRVHQELRKVDPSLPNHVAALIEKDNVELPAWQKNLLSSQLDVDRLDYLRRDSLFTGSGYGHFDWYRLLHTFVLHEAENGYRDLVWTGKARYSIEEYIFARFYMYENVYLHKTTRGFERILQAMWQRAKDLAAAGTDVQWVPALREYLGAESPSVQQYLAIEEFTVLSQIQVWAAHADRALGDLARRFLHRDGLAAIEAPQLKDVIAEDLTDFEAALHELVGRHGYDPPSAYVLRDDLRTSIYKAYFPEPESGEQVPINAIRVLPDDGAAPVEISEMLVRLKAVTNQPNTQIRYYVPKELRKEAERLQREWGE